MYYVLNVTLVRQKMSTNGATFLVLLLCWWSVGPDILATTTGYGGWGLSARVAGMVHYKLGTMGRPGVAVVSWKRHQKLAAKSENKEIDLPAGFRGGYDWHERVFGEGWTTRQLRQHSPSSLALLHSASSSLATPAPPPLWASCFFRSSPSSTFQVSEKRGGGMGGYL